MSICLIKYLEINKSLLLLFNSFWCLNSCWSYIDWCCCIFASILFLFFNFFFLNINLFIFLFFLFNFLFSFFFLFFLNIFFISWFLLNVINFLLHHPVCIEDISNTKSPPVTWSTESFLWSNFSTNIKSFNYHNINKESCE